MEVIKDIKDMFDDDDVLQKSVEYTFISLLSILILPCIFMNFFVMLKILKKNNYNSFNIVPKTIGLYYNIALCDLLMGVLVMPWVIYYIEIGRPSSYGDQTAVLEAHTYYNNKIGHRIFCVLSGYSYNVLVRVTSLTIFLLSIDRTHAIYFPITYSRPTYCAIYKYCTFGIWIFALGTQALPFIASIPYIEQPSREFICSWSITELLGLSQDDVTQNKIQIFFPYFILIDIPVVIPQTTSVILSFAVLFKIFYKRYQYITEKQNSALYSTSNQDLCECTATGKIKAIITFNWSKESHKIKSLTRASFTMLIIVMTYTICFAYYWFICISNTLYLLGVELKFVAARNDAYIYLNNSYQFATFVHATVNPFIVYYRVIRNFGGKSSTQGARSKVRSEKATVDGTLSAQPPGTVQSRGICSVMNRFKRGSRSNNANEPGKINGHFVKSGDFSLNAGRTSYNARTCEIGIKPEYV